MPPLAVEVHPRQLRRVARPGDFAERLFCTPVIASGCMKAKVTLRIEADLLRQARELAAAEGRSVSALLSDLLASVVRDRKALHKARRRALARLRSGFDLQWTPLSDRRSVHER